jgi:Flp pilus assembly protein TadG
MRGQAMVEFAAVLLPLVLVLVGIIQFGFLFSAYVGVSNAAREAARMATIYEFDTDLTPGQNDAARCTAVVQAADQSLDPAVPGTFTGSCDTVSGGGDFAIAYPDSGTCTGSSRTGCLVRVTLTYRQPLFVPLVGTFLGTDGTGQVPLSATVTMVIN